MIELSMLVIKPVHENFIWDLFGCTIHYQQPYPILIMILIQ